MSIYIGTKKSKLFLGDNKIKKIYVGTEKVFTAGNVVTYYVNTNTSYQEEVDSEASCLSPTTFTPELSGYTFVGWREDTTASGEVLSEKIMGDEPISLYAVFKKTFTLSFANNYASGGATNPVSGNQYYNNGNIVNPVVTLPADGYTRSGLTFIKWVLGTVGTKITLTADTTTRAVCKYSDMVPTYQPWFEVGGLSSGGTNAYEIIDGTKYAQIYVRAINMCRGGGWIAKNTSVTRTDWVRSVSEFNSGNFLYHCCSGIYNGYANTFINGVDYSNGSTGITTGPITINLPNNSLTIGCTMFDDSASESSSKMMGIKLIGRTVS